MASRVNTLPVNQPSARTIVDQPVREPEIPVREHRMTIRREGSEAILKAGNNSLHDCWRKETSLADPLGVLRHILPQAIRPTPDYAGKHHVIAEAGSRNGMQLCHGTLELPREPFALLPGYTCQIAFLQA
jgi:hypothetical protein